MDRSIVDRINQLMRPEVRGLQPYQAEGAGPAIRLDANESPFDVPDEMKREIMEAIGKEAWQRYPDPECMQLRQALAAFEGIPAESIVIGNGSDELIRDLTTVYGGLGSRTVFPSPTFSMYRLLTIAGGGIPVGVRLKEDWSLDQEGMLKEVAVENTKLVFIANPNNPTGKTYSLQMLESIINAASGIVVIDEAYRLFSEHKSNDLVMRYPNVVVMHTFSKAFSLAGVRMGYILAHPAVIDAVNRVRLPYNIDRFAQVAARLALEHKEHWLEQASIVKKERERLIMFFKSVENMTAYDSQANFILVRYAQAEALKEHLRKADIAVRGFSNKDGLNHCLRITVGQPGENQQLIEATESFVAGNTGRV